MFKNLNSIYALASYNQTQILTHTTKAMCILNQNKEIKRVAVTSNNKTCQNDSLNEKTCTQIDT